MTSAPSCLDAPLRFNGATHTAAKRYTGSSERTVPPDDTLANLRPHWGWAGISRLANITGLDRVGVPVVLAVRPTSRTLAVDSGKGLDLTAASASALMESFERSAAERFRPTSIGAAFDDLADSERAHQWAELPLARFSLLHRKRPVEWTTVTELATGDDRLVPSALLPLGRPWSIEGSFFQTDSSGLSSGNNFLEAVCAGMYELIERDAMTLWALVEQRRPGATPRLIPETVIFPRARDLLDHITASGVGVALFDCSVDTAVPVFGALLWDRLAPGSGVAKGYGCHLDPETALLRAVTEAVQARTVLVAASRDDLMRAVFTRLRAHDHDAGRAVFTAATPSVDVSALSSSAGATFQADVRTLMGRLAGAGFHRVLVVPLDTPCDEAAVVRVLVPGLESYHHAESFAPRLRAREFMEAHGL